MLGFIVGCFLLVVCYLALGVLMDAGIAKFHRWDAKRYQKGRDHK